MQAIGQAVLVGECMPGLWLVADPKQQANGAQLTYPVMLSRTPGSSGCAGTFLSTAQIPHPNSASGGRHIPHFLAILDADEAAQSQPVSWRLPILSVTLTIQDHPFIALCCLLALPVQY